MRPDRRGAVRAGRRQRGALGPRQGAATRRASSLTHHQARASSSSSGPAKRGGATAATRSRCTRSAPTARWSRRSATGAPTATAARPTAATPRSPRSGGYAGRCRSRCAGATRIVQRTVCVGGSRKRFCSARSINRIQTFWAEATVADNSPPTVAVVQDNPFTQGAWVNGNQSVTYTVSDNVGVRRGPGSGAFRHDRPCDYTRTIPCTNDPGRIDVDTTKLARGNAAARGARGGRCGQRGRRLQPVTVRVDRTAPGGSCGVRRGRRGMEVAELLRRCVAEPGRGRPSTDRGGPLAPVPLGTAAPALAAASRAPGSPALPI